MGYRLVLLGVIVVGGVGYWIYHNKDKWIHEAENMGKEAREFGKKTNNEGCLNEALSRHKRDNSFTGKIANTAFLTVCLQESEPSPGFCDGVPERGEITKSGAWALKRCGDAGLQNDQGCQQLFGVVQAHCRSRAYMPQKPTPAASRAPGM